MYWKTYLHVLKGKLIISVNTNVSQQLLQPRCI